MLGCGVLSKVLRNQFFRVPYQKVRRLSTAHETIALPCASNGNIQLKVFHPSTSLAAGRVVLYLPRGPILESPEHDALNIDRLRSAAPSHVVAINYRYGSQHEYPTPIHDVLAGFDWVVSNLLPKRAITRVGRSEHVGKLAVCGELLGGSLATALALTECRIGEPGIVAAALSSPIVDWVELPESGPGNSSNSKRSLSEIVLHQRNKLFRNSENYYDPFASPALFFRTAGYGVPEDTLEPVLTEMEELALLEREEYLREQQSLAQTSNVKDAKNQLPKANKRTKQRKSSRRYPHKALGLQLPSFNITAGKDAFLVDQAEELTHLLQQSFERQRKSGGSGDWSDKAQCEQHPGMALWDGTAAGRGRMQDIADWIAEELSV